MSLSDRIGQRAAKAKGFAAAAALFAGQAFHAGAAAAHESFAELVERLLPSVVNISVVSDVTVSAIPEFPFPEGSPFEDFFRRFMDPGQLPDGRMRPRVGAGSGFVISEEGYVVTNHHVVSNAREIRIETYDGEVLNATVVGTDEKTDIALLKVESGRPLQPLDFADSDDARVGDHVLVIGNPHGFGFSVSTGIVSARNRDFRGPYDDFIQTDAAINQGNSGGPLFNDDGEVIGVNTMIISSGPSMGGGGSIGIGFAMASNVVSKVVDQLRDHGTTRRGWLGVQIQPVTDDLAGAMGMEAASGALIAQILDGPAADAGLRRGDVILRLDGKDVDSPRDLVRMIADAPSDQEVVIEVRRNRELRTFRVKLGLREEMEPRQTASGPRDSQPPEITELGIVVSEITPELRASLELGEESTGLAIVEVESESEAWLKNVAPGDLLIEMDGTPVASAEEFRRIVKDARDAGMASIIVLVERDGQARYIALSLTG